MSKEMVISANPHETRVAILEEGQLCEYYVEREKEFALVGSIYKGKVTRVLPGMQSAFVEIGLDSDAFLYVSDFLEEIEELDHVVTAVEDKTQKMEAEGGQVFPANPGSAPIIEPVDVESSSPAPALEPLAGESISGGHAPSSFAAPAPRPTGTAPGGDRGRFENRSRGHRPGGDRGGRFGRRGGRGRSGGGGGRGGDRRFGRELPSSKYASSRPSEDHTSEPGTPEGHISILLPGESLAKFKERGPGDAPSSVAPSVVPSIVPSIVPSFVAHEPTTPYESSVPATHADESVVRDHAPIEPEEHQPETHESSPRETFPAREPFSPRTPAPFRASSSSGLEPLPGESLSKWKTHQHLPPEPVEAEARPLDDAPVPDAVRFAPLSPLVPTGPEVDSVPAPDTHIEEPETSFGHEAFDSHEPAATLESDHHEDHAHPDLTDDEATAVAEHIADAQDELAARDAQQRGFAEADAIAEAAGLSSSEEDHLGEDDSEDTEDVELEQEEAAAEEEGMIAHPEEEPGVLEHEIAAASESGDVGSALPGENLGSQAPQPFQARVRNDFRSRMQNPGRRGRDRGRRDDRGRRPQHGHSGGHGHHRPQQPRRTQLIADMLKQGQEIIVQIAKEQLGKKGARITSHVALPGRFLVYMPTLDHTGVSRKIASAEERSRLRHLVNDAKGASGGGFIVRTAAASAAPEEVRADVEFLTRTWAEIKTRSEQRKAPSLLHRDLNLVERILRDFITPDFGAIWVDTEDEYTKVVDFMSRFQPQLVNRVKLYTKSTPVFEEFGIQQEIDKGLRPKVWLKSGGYIVINHT
ncbi:MAG: ribonuclease E/G, partial [Candidatus Acidiferrales bacterium]